MGAQSSAEAAPLAPELLASEFKTEILKAARTNKDLNRYKELWAQSWPHRKRRLEAGDTSYDHELIVQGIFEVIRYGLRHEQAAWREETIQAAATFLHNKQARGKLQKLDFPSALSLVTMADSEMAGVQGAAGAGGEEASASQPRRGMADEHAANLARRGLLAVTVLCKMADFDEFNLGETSVLNFLSVVLNQVPEAVEVVTRVFRKLSDQREHRMALIEASVGDVLESFIKTVQCKRPKPGYSIVRWKRDVMALGNCACTLGTLIKYGHQCQVETATIINIFDTLGVGKENEDAADCLELLSEVARLFYWMVRTGDEPTESHFSSEELGDKDPDYVLQTLGRMWFKCRGMYEITKDPNNLDPKFCNDDLDKASPLNKTSPEVHQKAMNARKLICHMNCLLWLCLPIKSMRWKLRSIDFQQLHLAFEFEEPELFTVTLSTVRHLLDVPESQKCNELIEFFGNKLIGLVKKVTESKYDASDESKLRLIIDSIAILSLQRAMQEKLASADIYAQLKKVVEKVQAPQRPDGRDDSPEIKIWSEQVKREQRVRLACLFTLCEVSIHPRNRLTWMRNKDEFYPPRIEFTAELETLAMKEKDNEKIAAIAKLLLVLFLETSKDKKFHKKSPDVEPLIKSIMEWWQANTTAHFEELKEAHKAGESLEDFHKHRKPPLLKEMLKTALWRRETGRALRSIETMQYCSPHECVLALSLFSRLALEPKYKMLFRRYLEPLLECVCSGIWAEAREAAATLANLMWLPDLHEEHLVCWLKFDGPGCIAVDAANVLMPVQHGKPEPVAMGKGMYKNTWGIEFGFGTWITLHQEGLRNNEIPALLTTASPTHTFGDTSAFPYHWLTNQPEAQTFSITCWFYWPAEPSKTAPKALVTTTAKPTSAPVVSVAIEWVPKPKGGKDEGEFAWMLNDSEGTKWRLQMPKLAQGWHHLAVVSEKRDKHNKDSKDNKSFDGTRLFLDGTDWSRPPGMRHAWLENNFHIIGNRGPWEGIPDAPGSGYPGGDMPFGLIADFRIYAKALTESQVMKLAEEEGTESHPNQIVHILAKHDAVPILAQRLYVPDCAAECLRALGSLATHGPLRAQIFNVCGREALRLLNSPFPMIQRLAARLLNNLA